VKRVHYASYEINGQESYGTAELLNGSGWLFRKDGERKATVVSYKDTALMLYGLVDMADAQYIEDESRGGAAWIATHRQMEVA
jgi:hypothetical protein